MPDDAFTRRHPPPRRIQLGVSLHARMLNLAMASLALLLSLQARLPLELIALGLCPWLWRSPRWHLLIHDDEGHFHLQSGPKREGPLELDAAFSLRSTTVLLLALRGDSGLRWLLLPRDALGSTDFSWLALRLWLDNSSVRYTQRSRIRRRIQTQSRR